MSSPDLNEQRVQRYWSQIRRALAVLQKAQRHELEDSGEMQTCSFGDWLLFDDVSQAIQILQEGQQ